MTRYSLFGLFIIATLFALKSLATHVRFNFYLSTLNVDFFVAIFIEYALTEAKRYRSRLVVPAPFTKAYFAVSPNVE